MSILLWTCLYAALGGFLFGSHPWFGPGVPGSLLPYSPMTTSNVPVLTRSDPIPLHALEIALKPLLGPLQPFLCRRYDLGLIGSALLQIERYFQIRSSITVELIVGMAKLGAAAGTFLGGAAMARYGRQRALALNSLAFTAGPVIMAVATGPGMLVLGRFVVGIGVGVSATVSPAYIAELAPASTRGMLVQLYEVMLCVGMLSAPLVDWLLSRSNSETSWRAMVGLPAIPGLALAAAPLFLPESPRWLVTRGRLDQALEVLTSVMRGCGSAGKGPRPGGYSRMIDKDDQAVRDAEDELLQLWSCVQNDRNAVLEQRRKLWRQRQQRSGGRWGRFGCWHGKAGRPKPPSLEPIPEESGSQLGSPTLSLSSSVASPFDDRTRHHVAAGGSSGNGAGLASDSPATSTRSPPAPAKVGDSPNGDGGGYSSTSGGAANRAAVSSSRGASSRPGGTSLSRGWLLNAFGRRQEGISLTGAPSYSPLAGDDRRPASAGDPGGEPRSDSVVATAAGERDLLLPVSDGGAVELGEDGSALAYGPPASLADMPGEEPSLFATLMALVADISTLAVGPERRALWLALGLAFFDQVTAATAIINYAPTLLKRLDGDGNFDESSAMLYTVAIGITKAVGVVAALLMVDRCGRRPLLITGSLACSLALVGLTAAALAGSVDLLEVAMCAFTFFFSVSWAGLYWVVVSELFSMTAKSAATSAATALLFLTGSVTDLVFLSLHDLMGASTFLLFAALCLASAVYVWALLPETKGRTLAEVQGILARNVAGAGSESGSGVGRWIQLWERPAEAR